MGHLEILSYSLCDMSVGVAELVEVWVIWRYCPTVCVM